MRITKLPEAIGVNDADVTIIVQDGETRQIPRSTFIGTVPTDLQIADNHLQLTANGEAVGEGAELPKPWAKQITYNKADNRLLIKVSQGNMNDSLYAGITISLVCKEYTRNETEITSVNPLLSDFRDFTIIADPNDDLRTSVVPNHEFFDISERFHLSIDGEELDISDAEFTSIGISNSAQDCIRTITCNTSPASSYGDGLAILNYNYDFIFNRDEETLRNLFTSDLLTVVQESLTAFTVQYAEIPYIKTAEVFDFE